MKRVVQVEVFKAQCLEFIRNGQNILITRNHVPVAELKPIEKKKRISFWLHEGDRAYQRRSH